MKDKVIIIVGGTGGIGSVLARTFYDHGAQVTISARDEDKLAALKNSFEDSTRVLTVSADATDPTSVRKLFQETNDRFGHVDSVIISAGTWKQLSIYATTEEARDMIDFHYRGILLPGFTVGHFAQEFFREQGYGWIVNISSHAAVRPELEANLSYGTMKAASLAHMLRLRRELRDTPVRVTDLQPAIVNTPGNTGLDTADKRARAVQPEDIAHWIIDNFGNEHVPDQYLFDSTVVL